MVDRSHAIELVQEVSALVDRYGYDAVRLSIDFYNALPKAIYYNLTDGNGLRVKLNEEQYSSVMAQVRLGNKISAIKLVREFTSIGLREAKDVVERHAW